MKRSDPKQVAILSIVAVGAVLYLGFTLFGAGQKVASLMIPSTSREAGAKPEGELPAELLKDPFSHPKLVNADKQAPPQRTVAVDESPQPPALPFAGRFEGGTGLAPLSPIVLQSAQKGDQPAEIAGPDRKEIEAPRKLVALSAIVKVERQMAFLSVNGSESRAFRAGALLAPGLRLLSIGESSVKLGTADKTIELAVGGEVSL